MRNVLVCLLPLLVIGCAEEKFAENPGDFVRAEMFSHGEPQSVRCGCDAQGGLHITTPPGARVLTPTDSTFPSEAIVELPDDRRGKPIRVTKSLGFIGDNKLNETPIPHVDKPLTSSWTLHGYRGSAGYGYYGHTRSFYPRGY